MLIPSIGFLSKNYDTGYKSAGGFYYTTGVYYTLFNYLKVNSVYKSVISLCLSQN